MPHRLLNKSTCLCLVWKGDQFLAWSSLDETVSHIQVFRAGAPSGLSASVYASGPDGRWNVSWPLSFVCKLRDGAVGLTQTLQNVDGLASRSLKRLSALTHTWATSSSRGEGRTGGVGRPSVMPGQGGGLTALHVAEEREALTAHPGAGERKTSARFEK